jgi:hypothetical protein
VNGTFWRTNCSIALVDFPASRHTCKRFTSADEALEQLVRVFQFLLKLVASGIGVLAEQGEGAFVLAGGVQLEVELSRSDFPWGDGVKLIPTSLGL